MSKPKLHRDGWATAQAPHLITPPAGITHTSPRKKQLEAESMRAAVEAHIHGGGVVHILPGPSTENRFAKRAVQE